MDDSPPARMAGFVDAAATGNEPGNLARGRKGSPGSAGSVVGKSRGVVPEPPSPVIFVLDDDDEDGDGDGDGEEDGEEATFAADVDAVVDDLVAFAVEGPQSPSPGADFSSPPPVYRSTTTTTTTTTTLVPCAACADRAEKFDAAAAEKDELESAAEKSAALANEYRARMHHARLDRDGDGYVGLDELLRHELFASYSQAVVERIHAFFPYGDRGKHGSLDEDDFVKLTRWTEDRTTRDAQRFWFTIVDVDGDGVVGAHDVKWLYDSIWKGDAGTCVSLEDLVCQIADMAGARMPVRGDDSDGIDAPAFRAEAAGERQGAEGADPGAVHVADPRSRRSRSHLADLRRCGLAPGVFGLLVNHGDMLLRRSTAEFSDRDVPM